MPNLVTSCKYQRFDPKATDHIIIMTKTAALYRPIPAGKLIPLPSAHRKLIKTY